jgi:cold shock CspA family protein
MNGRVKKWDAKGFGIVVSDGKKYPVLQRDVASGKPLEPGQLVNFTTRKAADGKQNTLFATTVTTRGENLQESILREYQLIGAALGAKPN